MVSILKMTDLMGQYECQAIFGFELINQASEDNNLATGHCKGIDLVRVGQGELQRIFDTSALL